MFKYRLIILMSIFLMGCEGKKLEEATEEKESHSVSYNKVISQTDSIILFADQKISRRQEQNLEQRHILDSLESTIKEDRYTIRYELDKNRTIEQDLYLTRSQLEESLSICKKKEKRIEELNKKSEEEKNFLMSEIQKIVSEKEEISNTYIDIIDSLKIEINTLIDSLATKEIVKERKRRNKKKKS